MRAVYTLFGFLFDHGQGFLAGAEIAREILEKPEAEFHFQALVILKDLVEKRQGYDQAIEAVKIGLGSKNFSLNQIKLLPHFVELALGLMKRGQGIDPFTNMCDEIDKEKINLNCTKIRDAICTYKTKIATSGEVIVNFSSSAS